MNNPLHTGEAYRNALGEIEALMPAEAGSPEGERLDVPVTQVEAWEHKHFLQTAP